LILRDHPHDMANFDATLPKVDAVLHLIDHNKTLESLTISLKRDNYESRQLLPNLLLAIAKHPTLIKLTWSIPESLISPLVALSLVRACRRSIQELVVGYTMLDYEWYYGCEPLQPFGRVEEIMLEDLDPQEQVLANHIFCRTTIEEEEKEVFGCLLSLRKFHWLRYYEFEPFQKYLFWALSSSPVLQDVSLSLDPRSRRKDIGASPSNHITTSLKSLEFEFEEYYTPTIEQWLETIRPFHQLHTFSVPCMQDFDYGPIISHLVDTSFQSLQVIKFPNYNQDESHILKILTTFPNLKELEVSFVKISLQEERQPHNEQQQHRQQKTCRRNESDVDEGDEEDVRAITSSFCVQTLEEVQSIKAVVQDWKIRHSGWHDLEGWWRYWSRSQIMMTGLWREYSELGQSRSKDGGLLLRPIDIRFMLPIESFMTLKQRKQWHRGPKTITLAKQMATINMDRYPCVPGGHRDLFHWYDYIVDYDIQLAQELESERDYDLAKSRNRHHSLRDKKRSPFRRPFKK
jgi:hypothetical protein